MKRILITGADSFIGTSFERYVKNNYPDDYIIDTVNMKDELWKNYDFSRYDSIFHVAGIAHVDNGKVDSDLKELYYTVNRDLTVQVAKRAKEQSVKQFIFMSSSIVYGESSKIGQSKIITKDTPVAPVNYYGDSKLQAEIGLSELADDYFKIAVMRPPIIYGRGCKGNYASLVRFAKTLPVFPYVESIRSVLYIDNLCELVRMIIENNDSGIFHPQNSEYTNSSEMVKYIGAAHNRKIVLVKGFVWVLKFLSVFTSIVNKGFGNFAYDMSLSEYKQSYRVVSDIKDSIFLTENNN